LYYTKFWNEADFLFGEGSVVFQQCPVSDCWATSVKRPPLGQYDAVLFHPINVLHSLDPIQTWREPHQRFVLVHMESPRYYADALLPYVNFFNWTMTYVWESDIPRPLGYFVPKTQHHHTRFSYAHLPAAWIPYNASRFRDSLPGRSSDFLARARKPSHAAWLVSNCGTASQRETYIQELATYMNVSMAGRCSSAHGGRCDEDCARRLEGTTKFWLAFENAWCDDYVTEKFFRHVNESLVVVWGQANYSRYAPPHSYVNANDYDSPQALADYLLSMDDATYLSYFWWQDYYEVSAPVGDSRAHFSQSMCRLCERLHLDTTPKVYANVSRWFVDRGRCRHDDAP
jgi:alpha-1,3-fucosyltransferase